MADDRGWASGQAVATREPEPRRPGAVLTVPESTAFAAAVALLAMLADAAVGHAIAWENDPYWTYWVTDTFLIATVVGVGTAWLGVGVGRGALLVLIQTVVLTVYYWSLSPVGLPAAPQWLDLEHTWISGVPIHFGVYYLGYLTALWLWRRRNVRSAMPGRGAVETLLVGVAVVLVAGIVQASVFAEFQGVTWYVVRLVIVVPLLLIWQAVAGRDGPAALGGAVVLTAALTAYSHFLGPIGIPDLPLRLFERAAPAVNAHWLDYRDGVLVAMPITFVVALAGFAILTRAELARLRPTGRVVGGLLTVLAALTIVGAGIAPRVGPDADHARVTATGSATVETGGWFSGTAAAGSGELSLTAVQRNARITPLPPHNTVLLAATLHHSDGQTYVITADQPMIADPLGRFDTMSGVGLDVWQHGRSGIGDPRIPATRSAIAVFALGTVSRAGQQLATNVPIHAMTVDGGRIELNVGDPQTIAIASLPDGHLRSTWLDANIAVHQASGPRYLFGGLLLAALLALTGLGLRSQPDGVPRGIDEPTRAFVDLPDD